MATAGSVVGALALGAVGFVAGYFKGNVAGEENGKAHELANLRAARKHGFDPYAELDRPRTNPSRKHRAKRRKAARKLRRWRGRRQ